MAWLCCMGLVWNGKRARNMLEGIKEGFRPDCFFVDFFLYIFMLDFGLWAALIIWGVFLMVGC